MSKPSNKKWSQLTFSSVIFLFLLGCGVKGDPLPPERPPVLGRGQPTFRKATEEIKVPELPPVQLNERDNVWDEDDEE